MTPSVSAFFFNENLFENVTTLGEFEILQVFCTT
jgi:hypothetical protein